MNESEYDNCLPSTSSSSPNASGINDTAFSQKAQLNMPISLSSNLRSGCSLSGSSSDHPQVTYGPSTLTSEDVSEHPLSDQYVHHPNYEPDPVNEEVLPPNFLNGMRTTCDRCCNMRANAQRALDSAIIMSRKIARFESMKTENIQLQRQLGEANMYVEETLRKHHEQETELNAAKLEASKANKKLADLDKQYQIIVEKAKEAKDHANAANVWREKYERTCVIMEIVQEKRVKAQQRLDHALDVAMKNKKMNEESSKQIETLEVQNKMLKDQHKVFRKYVPMLYEILDSMIILTSRSGEYNNLSFKTKKAIDVVHRPETRAILLGDKVTAHNEESQSDEEAVRTLEKALVKTNGILPALSDDDTTQGPELRTSVPRAPVRGRGRGRARNLGRSEVIKNTSVLANALPVMDLTELERRHVEAMANKLKKTENNNSDASQINISSIHGKKGITVREQQAAQMQEKPVKERVAAMKRAIAKRTDAQVVNDIAEVSNLRSEQPNSLELTYQRQMKPLNEKNLMDDNNSTVPSVTSCDIGNSENGLNTLPVSAGNLKMEGSSGTSYNGQGCETISFRNMCSSAKTIRALEHIQRLERELEPQLENLAKPRALEIHNNEKDLVLRMITSTNVMFVETDQHLRGTEVVNNIKNGIINILVLESLYTDKADTSTSSSVSRVIEQCNLDVISEEGITAKNIIKESATVKATPCYIKKENTMQDNTNSSVRINKVIKPMNLGDQATTNLIDQEAPPTRVICRTGPTAPKRRRITLSERKLHVTSSNMGSEDVPKIQSTTGNEHVTENQCDDVESRLQIADLLDEEPASSNNSDNQTMNTTTLENSPILVPSIENETKDNLHGNESKKQISEDMNDNKNRRSSRKLCPTAKAVNKVFSTILMLLRNMRMKHIIYVNFYLIFTYKKFQIRPFFQQLFLPPTRTSQALKRPSSSMADTEAINSNQKNRRGRPRKSIGCLFLVMCVIMVLKYLYSGNIGFYIFYRIIWVFLSTFSFQCSQRLHSGDMWNVVKAVYGSRKISDCIHNKEEEKLMNVANALSGGGFWVPFVNEIILFMCRQSVIDPAQCGRNIRLIAHALEFMGDALSTEDKKGLVCSLMRMLLMEHTNVAMRALMFLLLSRAHSFLDWLIEDVDGHESRLLALHFHSQQDIAIMVRWAWSQRYSHPLPISDVSPKLLLSWWNDGIVQIDELSGLGSTITYQEEALLVNDDLRSLIKLCSMYLSPRFVIQIDRAEIVEKMISSSIQNITTALPSSDEENCSAHDAMFADLSKSIHSGLSHVDAARQAARIHLIIELLSSFLADGDHLLRTRISHSIAVSVAEIRDTYTRLLYASDNSEWIPITKVALSNLLRVIQVLTSHSL
uniref:Shootin-1 n=1 Tax=Heterorhabditis bacteriophora TaxID=37862 RepID=A0A1I7XDA0_HETBA